MARQLYSKPTLLCKTVPLFLGPHPGVRRSRRRKPGHRSLGTAAHQGKALAVEGCTSREVGATRRRTSHLCDPTKPRAENRKVHPPPSTAGWIPQGGGRPRLWRFFPRFLIGEKSGPAERPRQGRWFPPGKLEENNPFVSRAADSSTNSGTKESPGGSICFLRGFVMRWVSET